MTIEIGAPCPIIRIFDEDKARDFYLEYLGCSVDWENRSAPGAPLYMQVSRGALRLHLSEHVGDATPGATIVVPIKGVRALCTELTDKPYRLYNPSVEAPHWGGLVMELIDPFGARLRFQEG